MVADVSRRNGELEVIPNNQPVRRVADISPGRSANSAADEAHTAVPQADVDSSRMPRLGASGITADRPDWLHLELQTLSVAQSIPILLVGIIVADHWTKGRVAARPQGARGVVTADSIKHRCRTFRCKNGVRETVRKELGILVALYAIGVPLLTLSRVHRAQPPKDVVIGPIGGGAEGLLIVPARGLASAIGD